MLRRLAKLVWVKLINPPCVDCAGTGVYKAQQCRLCRGLGQVKEIRYLGSEEVHHADQRSQARSR